MSLAHLTQEELDAYWKKFRQELVASWFPDHDTLLSVSQLDTNNRNFDNSGSPRKFISGGWMSLEQEQHIRRVSLGMYIRNESLCETGRIMNATAIGKILACAHDEHKLELTKEDVRRYVTHTPSGITNLFKEMSKHKLLIPLRDTPYSINWQHPELDIMTGRRIVIPAVVDDEQWKRQIKGLIRTFCRLTKSTEVSVDDIVRMLQESDCSGCTKTVIRIFRFLCEEKFLYSDNSPENYNRGLTHKIYKVIGESMFGYQANKESKMAKLHTTDTIAKDSVDKGPTTPEMGSDPVDAPDQLTLEDLSRQISHLHCKLTSMLQTQEVIRDSVLAIFANKEELATRSDLRTLVDQMNTLLNREGMQSPPMGSKSRWNPYGEELHPNNSFYGPEMSFFPPSLRKPNLNMPGFGFFKRPEFTDQRLERNPLAQRGIWENIVSELRFIMIEIWNIIEEVFRSTNTSFIVIRFAPHPSLWKATSKPGAASETYLVCSISADQVLLQRHVAFSPITLNDIPEPFNAIEPVVQRLMQIVNMCRTNRMDMSELANTLDRMMYYLVGPGFSIQPEGHKEETITWTITKK